MFLSGGSTSCAILGPLSWLPQINQREAKKKTAGDSKKKACMRWVYNFGVGVVTALVAVLIFYFSEKLLKVWVESGCVSSETVPRLFHPTLSVHHASSFILVALLLRLVEAGHCGGTSGIRTTGLFD